MKSNFIALRNFACCSDPGVRQWDLNFSQNSDSGFTSIDYSGRNQIVRNMTLISPTMDKWLSIVDAFNRLDFALLDAPRPERWLAIGNDGDGQLALEDTPVPLKPIAADDDDWLALGDNDGDGQLALEDAPVPLKSIADDGDGQKASEDEGRAPVPSKAQKDELPELVPSKAEDDEGTEPGYTKDGVIEF